MIHLTVIYHCGDMNARTEIENANNIVLIIWEAQEKNIFRNL